MYSYVLNNPLSLTDPSGVAPCTDAGDPDPSGPFSGPIWQEGGPQIPITGNLYQILGLPNPLTLIFDANGPDAQQLSPSTTSYGQCVQSFNNSLTGKTIHFGSLLSLFDDTVSYLKDLLMGESS
jgi:hypothetical protein